MCIHFVARLTSRVDRQARFPTEWFAMVVDELIDSFLRADDSARNRFDTVRFVASHRLSSCAE
eukprot:5551241-Pyramimonas_sp.AAC.1